MTEPDQVLVTKLSPEQPLPSFRKGGASEGLPPYLLRQASKRLELVALVMFGAIAFAWLGSNFLEGELHHELTTPIEWVPNAILLSSSFLVWWVARFQRVSPSSILIVGLVYQVLISWSLPIRQYWHALTRLSSEEVTGDLVGVSSVALWMLFFTVIVPARPRYALAALTLSGLAVPTTIAFLMKLGDAPSVSTLDFVLIFVFPYAMTVVLAYIGARIIYGMGRDVQQAAELGSYQLLDRIGSGGMGEVWRARHNLLARPAAVKLIHKEALGPRQGNLESILRRFEREAQVTVSLQSPHTVALYDFGVSETGSLYYAMELLEGLDLETLVERFGPLPPPRVVHILEQVCRSLSEAHRRDLVHRDIKPANIFLCECAFERDFVKVLDFGLVKRVSVMEGAETMAVTGRQVIIGTPAYLAPELATENTTIDGRADIYSLGCVAFWLLTGRRPFEENSPLAMIVAHTSTKPLPPSEFVDGVTAPLDDLVLRCLAKNPADRPGTADEVAEMLKSTGLVGAWNHRQADEWWLRNR